MASVTWKDVVRVHRAHPTWTGPEIADELGCLSAYVRATASRRGMKIPPTRFDGVTLNVPRERVERLCKPGESPHTCLRRLVHKMLAKANA